MGTDKLHLTLPRHIPILPFPVIHDIRRRARLTFTTETSFKISKYTTGIAVLKNGGPGSGIRALASNILLNPGDYFELWVYVDDAGVHTSDYTSLAIEVQ